MGLNLEHDCSSLRSSMIERPFIVTCDVESDHPRFLDECTRGVEAGLPHLIDLMKEKQIPCDFFVSTNVLSDGLREIRRAGSLAGVVGSHGIGHSPEYYNLRTFRWHEKMLREVRARWRRTLGTHPTYFRAPNFSISSRGIRALSAAGFVVDSSVLPGRLVKKWRLVPILDHRGAPRTPYRPDSIDFRKRGKVPLIEFPLTENPIAIGRPLGLGGLRAIGLDKMLSAVRTIQSRAILFLVHPWELVDWSNYSSKLPKWIFRDASDDVSVLRRFLDVLGERVTFTSISRLAPSMASL